MARKLFFCKISQDLIDHLEDLTSIYKKNNINAIFYIGLHCEEEKSDEFNRKLDTLKELKLKGKPFTNYLINDLGFYWSIGVNSEIVNKSIEIETQTAHTLYLHAFDQHLQDEISDKLLTIEKNRIKWN